MLHEGRLQEGARDEGVLHEALHVEGTEGLPRERARLGIALNRRRKTLRIQVEALHEPNAVGAHVSNEGRSARRAIDDILLEDEVARLREE